MSIMPDWEAQVPPELAEELRTLHAQPQRAYHDWRHIEELLALFAEIEPGLHDARAVLFAVLCLISPPCRVGRRGTGCRPGDRGKRRLLCC